MTTKRTCGGKNLLFAPCQRRVSFVCKSSNELSKLEWKQCSIRNLKWDQLELIRLETAAVPENTVSGEANKVKMRRGRRGRGMRGRRMRGRRFRGRGFRGRRFRRRGFGRRFRGRYGRRRWYWLLSFSLKWKQKQRSKPATTNVLQQQIYRTNKNWFVIFHCFIHC